MFQQVVAITIIIYFVSRLIIQKKKKLISLNEFTFWIFFWSVTTIAIVFIKQLDELVATAGFSASGIDVLLYIGFIVLFYLVLKLRLKIEKMDRNITTIVRNIALNNEEKKHNNEK